MLNKVLAIGFALLILGKLFFRPQLRAVIKWFDGLVNAMLIAIALVYTLQIIIWFASGDPG